MDARELKTLVQLGRRNGLTEAEAEDAAQEAIVSALEHKPANPAAYARKAVHNRAATTRYRRRRSTDLPEEIPAPATARPDVAADQRGAASEEECLIEWINDAIEQVAFWGDGSTTRRSRGSAPADAEATLREYSYYAEVLRRLPGYGPRQRRRQRNELLTTIQEAIEQLRRTPVADPIAHLLIDLPVGDTAAPPTQATTLPHSLEGIDGCVLCTRFEVTNASIQTPDGPRETGPMTMFWFGTSSPCWAQGTSPTELAAIDWPRTHEFRCARTDDGMPLCILGDLIWRGVELARRLGPRITDRLAVETALAAHAKVYGQEG